ncbi:Ribosomal large subunit pseudouridine synthase A [Thalassocella blandensis]|nr:Ribosomal large subunit pseudouridine synthase A [Thalassocella blandensis]
MSDSHNTDKSKESHAQSGQPQNSDVIDTVYKDDDIIIVNKPSGLLCVPGLSEPDNLFDRVKSLHPNARVVHRLDMPTSGLIIFALHYEAQKALGKAFETRKINKTYSAFLHGELAASCGEIHSPIICDWPQRPKQKIDWLNGKPAITFFQRIHVDRSKNYTAVQLTPHTGRTHQLRVHMMQIGHPILGDNFYADDIARDASPRLCLHAEKLVFSHPMTQEPLSISTPAGFAC